MDAELQDCRLCEWQCGVDRLAGEQGVCLPGEPQVALRTLHPAPPASYTVFMAGCNLRCLHCQNWDIAQWPEGRNRVDGHLAAGELAKEALKALASSLGRGIGADRIFFSGGEATCSLPFVEEVVWQARKLDPSVRINFDTNGFMTEESLRRVLSWTTSVTFDLRAVDDEVHRALTGAPAGPVLRNARMIAEQPEKLWEFRILVVPGVNDGQIEKLSWFIAGLGTELPVCFLAFRPNFVLEHHRGAPVSLMLKAVNTARDCGLRQVAWSGRTDLLGGPRELLQASLGPVSSLSDPGARLAAAYAMRAGCLRTVRDCGHCEARLKCGVKSYRPIRCT